MISESDIKQFYTLYHDHILDKRYNSPYWLRRYVHRQTLAQFLPYLKPGQRVLDAGCGEGMLSCLIAQRGIEVVGMDISAPNIERAYKLAAELGVQVTFLQGDAEKLPFPDNSFDVVLSSHVLEHLPDLNQGIRELYRVTRSLALVAMPTCLSPACWVLLGGDSFWKLGRHSPTAMIVGFIKTLISFIRGEEGPNENYAGNKHASHIWRFPWLMRRHINESGFLIRRFEAGPLIIPYAGEYFYILRRIQPAIDSLRASPILREMGYGSLAVCTKNV